MMTLFFPCKKARRSQRLLDVKCCSPSESHSQASPSSSPSGIFEILPLEMQFLLFSYLPVEDLSMLTITSKALRDVVERYLTTEIASRRVMRLAVTHSMELEPAQLKLYLDQFRQYGVLLKRMTCLYPTKQRLKLVQAKFHKHFCAEVSCPRPDKCPSLNCFGRFLRTFTAGWEDRECVVTFDAVSQLAVRQLRNLVRLRPGVNPQLELHVRVFFRRVFIDNCLSDTDKSLWLSLILKPFAMVDQARVLFLLFGPICHGLIQWYDLCEKTPSTKSQTVVCFGDLAGAFRALHQYSREWTEDAVISVIDELMCSPDEWLPENVAAQLYLCGDSITVKVLTSKALNGRTSELSAIFLSLCLVCVRQRQSLDWTVDIVRRVCSAVDNRRDRRALLRGIVDAFQAVILDLHDFSDDYDPADTADHDLRNLLDVQSSFVWEIMQMAFNDLISR